MDMVLSQTTVKDPFQLGAQPLAELAYADDLVLLSSTHDGLSATLDSFKEALRLTGMSINMKKTKYFNVGVFRGGFTENLTDQLVLPGADPIPCTPMDETFRYLGIEFSSRGICSFPLLGILKAYLERIDSAPWSRHHKYLALKDYALTKLQFGVSKGLVNIKD
ncbi:Uncharacterized protein FKW44_021565 [Caligus rogercresseyi]|uniref:Reverse transcriptase domain-containing protein n=1 Tax=Caligus rogercresseyi TaxID=217165 RepID=A0A7T8GRI7_CALRO|nr:Uncharacterized protein FKW44_021565 [Caligus rogercresseyi]